VAAIIRQWRDAHPAIRAFWRDLARTVRVAIRTGTPILVAPAPRAAIVAAVDGTDLTLTLPSGRVINYSGARLVPNTKFEDGDPDIEFYDNARGQWTPTRAWFGTFVENVVQGTARDLLAAALLRFEAHGLPVVFHCHDEVVIEIPEGAVAEQEISALLCELPPWASGLPLSGKVHAGPLYLEAPATAAPPLPKAEPATVERAIDAFVASVEFESNDTAHTDTEADSNAEEDATEIATPLFALVTARQTSDRKTRCPFHEGDDTPSLQLYADHYHCFACDAHGDAVAWLTSEEGMSLAEACAALREGGPGTAMPVADDPGIKIERALALWDESRPIAGTAAERYLVETRGIALAALDANLDAVLRFHPRCPFGPGTRHPSLVALLRDPVTDTPVGIQRIALTSTATKIGRRMLGHRGVVKLQPAGIQLVIGEGLETTLAGTCGVTYCDAPVRPAWAAMSADQVERFPVLPGIERLVILVDHDSIGKNAAACCAERWSRAGRTVVRLTPKRAGADFNDLTKPEPVA
jgi:Toprim domain/CHC2 zinc finger